MKKYLPLCAFLLGTGAVLLLQAFTDRPEAGGYILQRESEIATVQPGPHKGGGETVSYPFSQGTPGFKLAFRKRVLKPGSAIGYHLQKEDEVYYILEGTGMMQMNGDSFAVRKGDAVLTRPGSSHGIRPVGGESLTLLIAYELPAP